jgi:hypothetical protein
MRPIEASIRTGWLVAAAAAAGCAHGNGDNGARTVSLAEFAQPPVETAPDEATAASAAGETVQPVVARAGEAAVADEFADEDDFFDDEFFDEEFGERTALRPSAPGEPVIVDSLVGHVNGRPIFADDFLLPIEDRLLRAAEETYGVEQQMEFRKIILDWLRDVVTNELLLAEAEASLSSDEQRGLFAWLRMMYDEEIRRGGGTRSGAEQRQRQSGSDLDEYLGDQKNLILIDQLQRQRIQPRVIVSWRDIEREYERLYDEFNPPASVTLARLRLNSITQTAAIDSVNERLAAGEPFADIAEELGFADGGLWETFEMGPGGITDIEVSDPMKAALEGLEEGQTSAPFTLGSGTLWLHVVEVQRPESRSIYDPQVQLGLRNTILARRANAEWNRFVNSLLERGVYDELDEMAERLYQIALLRYGR